MNLTTTWLSRITDAVLLEAGFTAWWCKPGFEIVPSDPYGELAIELRERFVTVAACERAEEILGGPANLPDM